MLITALREALGHTTITAEERMEPAEAKARRGQLGVGTDLMPADFRRILDLEEYLPNITLDIISWYRINTQEPQMTKLSSEIAKLVGIGEGQHIFSCTCVLMGGQPAITASHVAEKMILTAIKFGPEEAVALLDSRISDQTVTVNHLLLAEGVTVEEELKIGNDIKIIPISEKHKYILPFIIRYQYINPQPFVHSNLEQSAIIITEHTLTPAFKIVAEGYEQSEPWPMGVKHTIEEDDENAPERVTTSILSLAINSPVIAMQSWIYTDPYEPFRIDRGSFGARGFLDGRRTHQSVQASSNDLAKFQEIRRALLSEPDMTRRLKTPISYWVKSRMAGPSVDGAIYLGIAMETLFLDNSETELSYRMQIRAAKLVGGDMSQRELTKKLVKDSYSVRSRATHQGALKTKDQEIIEKGQGLIRDAILKIIEAGTYPDWDRLDLK